MDSQIEKISSLPPVSSCTIKRSFVKVSSKEYKSESMPSLIVNRREAFDKNRKAMELKNRPESPHTTFRLKLCDSSSGYGSATSFSSAHHSIQKTPSVHCFSNFTQKSIVKQIERPNKAHMVRDSLINVLDQIDKRVAFLRETAHELEDEKRKLLRVLNSIITSEELNAIEDVEQEEIKVTTHGLLYRLNSVDVVLTTPRTDSQQKALEIVNSFIEKLYDYIKTDKENAKQVCLTYLTACTSDNLKAIPVDDKFQKVIIECAVDDQKTIKKKLENLFSTLNKIEN